jgi:hypothetical protein
MLNAIQVYAQQLPHKQMQRCATVTFGAHFSQISSVESRHGAIVV